MFRPLCVMRREVSEVLRYSAPGQIIELAVLFFQSAVIVLTGTGEGDGVHRQDRHGLTALLQTLVAFLKEFFAESLLVSYGSGQFHQHHRIVALAAFPVADANGGAVEDFLVACHQAFDVDREDLVTIKASDHALDAANDEEETILIHIAQVTRVDPDLAVLVEAHHMVRLLGTVVIALHHGGAGGADLAQLVVAQFFAGFLVKDRDGGSDRRDSHTLGLEDIVDAEGRGSRKLGHTVTLSQGITDAVGLHKISELAFQAFVHGIAAGAQSHQEGKIHILEFFAVHQRFVEGGGADHVLGAEILHHFAKLVHIELGDGDQLEVDGQRHMHPAAHTVGGEDGNDIQEPLTLLHGQARMLKVKGSGVDAIIGDHHALRKACGAAGIGDGKHGVAHIGRLRGACALALGQEGLPADDLITVGDIGLGHQRLGDLFYQGKGTGRRLGDDIVLLDILHDGSHLGEGDINGDENMGAGLLHSAANAFNVHAGIDHVGRGAQLVDRVEGADRLRQGHGEEGDLVALLDPQGGKGIGARVDIGLELTVGDVLAIIMNGGSVQPVGIILLHILVSSALGEGKLRNTGGEVLHPHFSSEIFKTVLSFVCNPSGRG